MVGWGKRSWADVRGLIFWIVAVAVVSAGAVSWVMFRYPQYAPPGPPPAAARFLIAQPPPIVGGPLLKATTQAGADVVPVGSGASCTGARRIWLDTGRTEQVDVVAISCEDVGSAENAQYALGVDWRGAPTAGRPPVPDGFEIIGAPPLGFPAGNAQALLYRQGAVVLVITVVLADGLDASVGDLIARTAVAESPMVPGAPGPGAPPLSTHLTASGLAWPLDTFSFCYLIWAIVGAFGAASQTRASRPHPGSGSRLNPYRLDVGPEGLRLAGRSFWRLVLRMIALGLVHVALTSGLALTVGGVVLPALPLALSAYLRRRAFDRKHTVQQPSPLNAGEHAAVAARIALCAVALVVAMSSASILLWLFSVKSAKFAVADGRLLPAGHPGSFVSTLAYGLPISVLAVDAAVMTALATLATARAYRATRHRLTLALSAASERDARPPVVLFRNHATSNAVMHATSFSREPWPARLSLAHSQPFEIFLTTLLRRYGPVIAVNPQGVALPPIPGVTTLDPLHWSAAAEDLAARASILVASTMPDDDKTTLTPVHRVLEETGALDKSILIAVPGRRQRAVTEWARYWADPKDPKWPSYSPYHDADRLLATHHVAGTTVFWEAQRENEYTYTIAVVAALRHLDDRRRFIHQAPPVASNPPVTHSTVASASVDNQAVRQTRPIDVTRRNALRRKTLKWAIALAAFVMLVLVNLGSATSANMGDWPDLPTVTTQRLLGPAAVPAPFAVQTVDHPAIVIPHLSDAETCGKAYRRWRNADSDQWVEIDIVSCAPPGSLVVAQAKLEDLAKQDGVYSGTLAAIPYSLLATGHIAGGYKATQVVYRQTVFLVYITVADRQTITSGDRALLSELAVRQSSNLEGLPGPGFEITNSAASDLVQRVIRNIVTASFYLVLLRLVVGGIRMHSTAVSNKPKAGRYFRLVIADVTARAWSLRGKAVIVAACTFFGSVCAIAAVGEAIGNQPGAVGLTISTIVIFTVRGFIIGGKRPRLRSDRGAAVFTGKRPVATMAWWLSSMASFLATAMVLWVALIVFVVINTPLTLPGAEFDFTVFSRRSVPWSVMHVSLAVVIVDLLCLAAFLLWVGGRAHRQARAASEMTCQELLAKDPRRPVLYLRNFNDDELIAKTSFLAGTSLVRRLSLARFERFESVLVRHLQSIGPVIATSQVENRGEIVRTGRLGAAARLPVLPGGIWKHVVSACIEASCLVVVGATPVRMTAGLKDELDMIEQKRAVPRALLLLAPLAEQDVAARWKAFASYPDTWLCALPAEISDLATRALVAAYAANGDFELWTGGRRSEWAYAAALRAAAAERNAGSSPEADAQAARDLILEINRLLAGSTESDAPRLGGTAPSKSGRIAGTERETEIEVGSEARSDAARFLE